MNKQQHALILPLDFTAQLFPVRPCQQATNSNQTKQTEAENSIKKKKYSTSVPQRFEFCRTADNKWH